ncbi:hypothetical protein ACT453_10125 [Bacillus sp. D-CC]
MNLIKKIKQIREEKDIFLEKGVEVGSAIIFDGIAGQVIPGIVGLRMDYKQKQMEKRLNIGMGLLIERLDQVEEGMRKLNHTEYCLCVKTLPLFELGERFLIYLKK